MKLIKNAYYKLGGKKGSFLQKRWSNFCKKRILHRKIKAIRNNGLDLLNSFQCVCNNKGVKGWPEFGTLLGAYREKSFIPYDYDIDIGMFSDDYNLDFEKDLLLAGFVKKREYFLIAKEHNQSTLTEVCYEYKGIIVDLFLSIRDNNIRKTYVYTDEIENYTDKIKKRKVKYFSFDMAESFDVVTINGISFSGPGNTCKLLKQIYGDDFMQPQSNWIPDPQKQKVTYLDSELYYGECHIISD